MKSGCTSFQTNGFQLTRPLSSFGFKKPFRINAVILFYLRGCVRWSVCDTFAFRPIHGMLRIRPFSLAISDNEETFSESERGEVDCGVPQSSVYGPLFFLLCVDDMVRASEDLDLVLFTMTRQMT